jgi:hypothetical protein
MSAAHFTIGSPLRAMLGVLLLCAASSVLLVSHTIDWGVAWTAVIPALALLIPAWALLQRKTLTCANGKLLITSGWLWRRAIEFKTTDAELELLPTAGLMAVVLHRGTSAQPLATFVLPSTAQRLATWLDEQHPQRAFPRQKPLLPEGDR